MLSTDEPERKIVPTLTACPGSSIAELADAYLRLTDLDANASLFERCVDGLHHAYDFDPELGRRSGVPRSRMAAKVLQLEEERAPIPRRAVTGCRPCGR